MTDWRQLELSATKPFHRPAPFDELMADSNRNVALSKCAARAVLHELPCISISSAGTIAPADNVGTIALIICFRFRKPDPVQRSTCEIAKNGGSDSPLDV